MNSREKTERDGTGRQSDCSAEPASFRQLKLLEAVGRLGSISRAATECGLTQPAATQALAVLARKAGVAILAGRSRAATLTPVGRDLHGRAVSLIAKLDRGLQMLEVAERDVVIWRITHAQLRLLGATLDRGSLEFGASVLNISLRAAKRSIGALEGLVGHVLLTRKDGALRLTSTGAALAGRIGLLAEEVTWSLQELRDNLGRAFQTVVIGAATEPGIASLTAAIETHTARHPRSCVEIFEAAQGDLLARLSIGEVDLVLGHILGTPGAGLVWEEIAAAEYRIVAGRDHPLAARREVTLRDLVQYGWIFGARGSQRRAVSDTLFASGQKPHCMLVTSAPPLMARFLAQTELLTLMTDQELSRYNELAQIGFSTSAARVRIGLARRSGWTSGALQTDLIDAIKEHLCCSRGGTSAKVA